MVPVKAPRASFVLVLVLRCFPAAVDAARCAHVVAFLPCDWLTGAGTAGWLSFGSPRPPQNWKQLARLVSATERLPGLQQRPLIGLVLAELPHRVWASIRSDRPQLTSLACAPLPPTAVMRKRNNSLTAERDGRTESPDSDPDRSRPAGSRAADHTEAGGDMGKPFRR